MRQGLDTIIAFQSRGRLNIKSLATGGDVMDKTFQTPTVVSAHRYNIATIAIGDQSFLENPLKLFIL